MKRHLIFLLVFVGLFFNRVEGQPLLDSIALKEQKTFYNISSSTLQEPDSVFKLDLSRKKLKNVPEVIKSFKNLQVLKLSRNKLRELPDWIGSLHNLQYIDVSNNRLKGLPDSIGYLENLVFLGLNRNLIERLPHEIGLLKNLEILEMWDNELGAVPEEIKNLHNLRIFELRGILFSEEDQRQISDLLPDTHIYFSPSCNCKN